MRLRIVPLQNEPLRGHVESESTVLCRACSSRSQRAKGHKPKDGGSVSGQCKKCGAAALMMDSYLVDLSMHDGAAECGCPHWQIEVRGQVLKATSQERMAMVQHVDCPWFCKHIRAFRNFVLNRSIRQHIERGQVRREEMAA